MTGFTYQDFYTCYILFGSILGEGKRVPIVLFPLIFQKNAKVLFLTGNKPTSLLIPIDRQFKRKHLLSPTADEEDKYLYKK